MTQTLNEFVQHKSAERALLTDILRLHGVDPEKVGGSGQTAFQYLEAAVCGALDDLEQEHPDVAVQT